MKIAILDNTLCEASRSAEVAKKYFTEVEVHNSAAELYAALKAAPLPDLILVHVGKLDAGISEVANLEDHYDSSDYIPVVAVTGSTEKDLHHAALNSGLDAVMVSPVLMEEFKFTLETLLPQHMAERG